MSERMRHFVKHRAVILLLSVWPLLAGCSRPTVQSSAVDPDASANSASSLDAQMARAHAVDVFVWEALPDLPDGAPLHAARKLGKLVDEKVTYKDNEYIPGRKIEERTLTHDGLVISGWVDGGKFRRTHVLVTKPVWRVRDGLGVGAGVQDLARVLGRAQGRSGDVFTYSGETESVRFTIRDGKVAQVEFLIYHE